MDQDYPPTRGQARRVQSPRHVAAFSADAGSASYEQRPSTAVRRRPSISAMAALFSPSSSSKSIHNSWKDVSQSSRRVSRSVSATSAVSNPEHTIIRARRPSMTIANIKRGLFGHKSREEVDIDEEDVNIDQEQFSPNTRTMWLRKLAGPFKKERVSSSDGSDTTPTFDAFYSLSTGGAAARAAAAAQNQASSSSLLGQRRDISRLREPQDDSESGIGIDLNDGADDEKPKTTLVRVDPASVLPEEIFAYCLTFLDAMSLTDAELVSKRWHLTAGSQSMWRNLFGSEFGRASLLTDLPQSGGLGYGNLKAGQEWKKMWKARKALQQRWTRGHAAAIYLEGHADTVYCVQFDENKIITGSRDRTLRIWDMETLQCTKIIGTPKSVGHAHAAQPLSRPTRGHIPFKTIIPTKDYVGPPPTQHNPSITHHGSVLCLQFDSEILVTGSSDTTVIIWSIKHDYLPIRSLERHTAGVLDVCFDKNYIVSCSKDTTICLWSRDTGELIRQLSGHRGPVNAVQLRGELVVSASGDGIAKLWNITSGLCVKEFSSRDRGLACVEFSPDCRFIYAGGNDQSIYQFDATTRELVREFKGHRGLVRSLHLDQLNNRIVSGSYDHSIQVYDTQSGTLMCEFAGWTTSWMLSAKVDYRRIVATSQDRRVVLIDFGLGVKDVELLSGCP